MIIMRQAEDREFFLIHHCISNIYPYVINKYLWNEGIHLYIFIPDLIFKIQGYHTVIHTMYHPFYSDVLQMSQHIFHPELITFLHGPYDVQTTTTQLVSESK